MSPNRCATHHICDCRQARLGAAEKEVKRLQGQLEYHHTTCPSNLSSALKGMQEREATISTLQANNDLLAKSNEELLRLLKPLQAQVEELRGVLSNTQGSLHVINYKAGMIRRWKDDPKATVSEWAEKIEQERTTAHMRISEALASTPHSAGRRVEKLEALYQSAKILRDTDEEAIVFQVYKDICVHLAALDEAKEER